MNSRICPQSFSSAKRIVSSSMGFPSFVLQERRKGAFRALSIVLVFFPVLRRLSGSLRRGVPGGRLGGLDRIEAKPVESDELPGTIVLQEGVRPNEKYNPNTINYITLSYSEYPTILIQFGTVGRSVDEVYNELTDAGFTVYTNSVDRNSLTEKERSYGPNRVVRINPDEGNYFRQEGNAAIYLYYYEGE